jgi:hypothetical protein
MRNYFSHNESGNCFIYHFVGEDMIFQKNSYAIPKYLLLFLLIPTLFIIGTVLVVTVSGKNLVDITPSWGTPIPIYTSTSAYPGNPEIIQGNDGVVHRWIWVKSR